MHEVAFPWLKQAKTNAFGRVIAGHTLAELYAVLSTLPIKPRISPAVVWRLIQATIEAASKIISLIASEINATIKRLSESGDTGGIVYGALITKVAQKPEGKRLLTFNSH